MKQIIEFLGRPLFVFFTWSILSIISFLIFQAFNLTANVFLLVVLTFLLYVGTMAYGFFYFHANPTHRISSRYYRKKKFETLWIYKAIGVEIFRKLLINSPFKKLNQRVYLRGRKEYIEIFYEETKRSETSHLIGLAIGLFFHLFFVVENAVFILCCSVFFNLVMNLYPILLQRYNRIKIRP